MNRNDPPSTDPSVADTGMANATDPNPDALSAIRSDTTARVKAGIKKRYARERRFRLYGLVAILASLSFLAMLIVTITKNGLPAFQQTFIQLDVTLDSKTLGLGDNPDISQLRKANYNGVIKNALLAQFPDCLLYTSPSPRDLSTSRMPSSA